MRLHSGMLDTVCLHNAADDVAQLVQREGFEQNRAGHLHKELPVSAFQAVAGCKNNPADQVRSMFHDELKELNPIENRHINIRHDQIIVGFSDQAKRNAPVFSQVGLKPNALHKYIKQRSQAFIVVNYQSFHGHFPSIIVL